MTTDQRSKAAAILGRAGGKATAARLTPEERSASASRAGKVGGKVAGRGRPGSYDIGVWATVHGLYGRVTEETKGADGKTYYRLNDGEIDMPCVEAFEMRPDRLTDDDDALSLLRKVNGTVGFLAPRGVLAKDGRWFRDLPSAPVCLLLNLQLVSQLPSGDDDRYVRLDITERGKARLADAPAPEGGKEGGERREEGRGSDELPAPQP